MTSSPEKNTDDNSQVIEKVDYVFKLIGRYDTYINSTNTKASLVIAWNGVVIGTILLKYNDLLMNYEPTKWAVVIASILLTLMGICSVVSIALIFNVIFPFLKSTSRIPTGRVLTDESTIFFGSVAQLSAAEYQNQIRGLTSGTLLADLTDQAVILAQGLNAKMELIRKSILAIMGELLLIAALLILKVF
jgi:hypothetical protein